MEWDAETREWHHEAWSGSFEGAFTFASRFEEGVSGVQLELDAYPIIVS